MLVVGVACAKLDKNYTEGCNSNHVEKIAQFHVECLFMYISALRLCEKTNDYNYDSLSCIPVFLYLGISLHLYMFLYIHIYCALYLCIPIFSNPCISENHCILGLRVSFFTCILVSLYPCIPVSLYPCIPLTLYPCTPISILPVSLYPYIPAPPVSLYFCFSVSPYLCIHISLYPSIPPSMG